jgi:hypothetical protein
MTQVRQVVVAFERRADKWIAQVRKNGKRREAIFRTEKEALNWEADWRRKPVEEWESQETPTGSYLIDWAGVP